MLISSSVIKEMSAVVIKIPDERILASEPDRKFCCSAPQK